MSNAFELELPASPMTEEEIAEASRLGQEMALKMMEAVQGSNASTLAMLNAIGSIVEGTFATMPVCHSCTLEEYDNWCAYTRARIVAEQQGEGQTRQ